MSRLKRFAAGVLSGYAAMFANIIYTMASVPLALHYLSKIEFGLWALVTQISGYLLLVDLGMTGSISRILIDHKDRPSDGVYGAIIKTGTWVLAVQGAIIAAGGILISLCLPKLFDIPAVHRHDFQFLVAGYCVVTGALFVSRIFGSILVAHQRYDISNYLQIAFFAVSFAGMWLGFNRGFGIYAMLVSNVAGMLVTGCATFIAVLWLDLFPAPGSKTQAGWPIFKELFFFGTDLFLLSVGLQLLSASQVVIITQTLGLEAAAVWSIATKPFALAQQFVGRLWDFSSGAASEMVVRGERERLEHRFRDLVTLTASMSVLVGVSIALCNNSFLEIWTKGRIAWNSSNDCLMAGLLAVTSVTRVHIGLMGQTKMIGAMRYIYFLEGASFVLVAFLIIPYLGIPGMIGAAILMDIIWSGIYGTHRTAAEFSKPIWEVAGGWLLQPLKFASVLAPLAWFCWWVTRDLASPTRFGLNSSVAVVLGTILMWTVGITPRLRDELVAQLKKRLW
jgi:O-antigen/teichoic acid export membrane protein